MVFCIVIVFCKFVQTSLQTSRIVIGVWIIYCLIISSAYSGNLKAYLTTPMYSDPINSLKDVVESGLPWGMVLYGEDEERLMQQSQDPIIQTIWISLSGYKSLKSG